MVASNHIRSGWITDGFKYCQRGFLWWVNALNDVGWWLLVEIPIRCGPGNPQCGRALASLICKLPFGQYVNCAPVVGSIFQKLLAKLVFRAHCSSTSAFWLAAGLTCWPYECSGRFRTSEARWTVSRGAPHGTALMCPWPTSLKLAEIVLGRSFQALGPLGFEELGRRVSDLMETHWKSLPMVVTSSIFHWKFIYPSTIFHSFQLVSKQF